MKEKDIPLHAGDIIYYRHRIMGGARLSTIEYIYQASEPLHMAGETLIGLLPADKKGGEAVTYFRLGELEVLNVFREVSDPTQTNRLNTRIICGFPGIGKSHLARREIGWKIADLESSEYSWGTDGERNKYFPDNYVNNVMSRMGDYDFIFVSSHKEVRQALRDKGIEYTIYYPSIEDKEIYMRRYEERGNPIPFLEKMFINWGEWIDEIEKEEHPMKVKMKGDTYLRDYLKEEGKCNGNKRARI